MDADFNNVDRVGFRAECSYIARPGGGTATNVLIVRVVASTTSFLRLRAELGQRVRQTAARPARRSTVMRNSFWFGLEMVLDVLLGTALSIAVARVIGPSRLGQFVYFTF